MAKKKFNMSKLGATTPAKKVIKKPTSTNQAIAAIHKSKPVRTSLDIDAETHKKLKIRAVESGATMKELIIRYILEGLEG